MFLSKPAKLINIRWFFCMVPGNRLKPGKPLLMAEMDFKIFLGKGYSTYLIDQPRVVERGSQR